ncbi:hypothetical protein [Flavobacterium suzhouense]|uniref:DUF4468 domain-containing protein n=1 Tax=Flavobacterium suzhouense TaxID=1529638 RepID=A0ABW5NPW8_9FLAO
MKTRLFTATLLLALSLSGQAQDKYSLKAATQKMIDLTDQENYEDLIGTVYPGYFNVVTKEDYINQLQKKIEGPDYIVHRVRVEPSIDYGAVKKTEYTTFCLINYDTMLTVELKEKTAPENVAAKEAFFKKLFGTEDAYYIDSNNTVDVKKRLHIIAIADESTSNQWTFIDPSAPNAREALHEVIRKELDGEGIEEVAASAEPQTPEQAKLAKYAEAKKAEEAKRQSVKKKS